MMEVMRRRMNKNGVEVSQIDYQCEKLKTGKSTVVRLLTHSGTLATKSMVKQGEIERFEQRD